MIGSPPRCSDPGLDDRLRRATAGSQIRVSAIAGRGSAHGGPGGQSRGCLAGQLASRPAGELGDHRVTYSMAGIPGVALTAHVLRLPDGGLTGVLAIRGGRLDRKSVVQGKRVDL